MLYVQIKIPTNIKNTVAPSRFRPTKVALKFLPDKQNYAGSLYQVYRAGKHTLTRNERQQLGFRLANRGNDEYICAIDHHASFTFNKVIQYAKNHNNDDFFVKD